MRSSTSVGRRAAAVAVGAAVAVVFLVGSALGALAAPSPQTGPPTTDPLAAARFGAGWVARQVDAGLPLQVFGSDDWGTTVDAGLALAAAGVAPDQAAAVWDAVVANRELVVAPGPDGAAGPDNPGRLAKLILFATVAGKDPRAVGAAPGQDLVARLEDSRRLQGEVGLYGSEDPTFDGAYRQGLALVALRTAGATPDPTAVTWLTSQQCADGSWMPYRSDLSAPCARTGFIGPETNSTATAVVGLTSVGETGTLAASADWLDAAQNADGGWGFFPGDASDPNSTALTVQAIAASGRVGEPRFTGALGSLLSFQLGCASPVPDRGAFTFPGTGGGPDTFATVQAVPAGMAVGVALGSSSEAGPVVDCSRTGTSTTTTTTTSTTTTTTAVVAQTSGPSSSVLPATVAGTSTSSGSGSQLALTGSATADLAWLGGAFLVLGVAALLLRHHGVRP